MVRGFFAFFSVLNFRYPDQWSYHACTHDGSPMSMGSWLSRLCGLYLKMMLLGANQKLDQKKKILQCIILNHFKPLLKHNWSSGFHVWHFGFYDSSEVLNMSGYVFLPNTLNVRTQHSSWRYPTIFLFCFITLSAHPIFQADYDVKDSF